MNILPPESFFFLHFRLSGFIVIMNARMFIYIGADHRGFELKESLKGFLKTKNYEVFDLGNDHLDKDDDYSDFAKSVAEKISADPSESRGVLICGSGVGMDIAANRFKNVRSVLAFSPEHAAVSRKDDDTNVLSLAADFLKEDEARGILSVWLETSFSGEEKYMRRINKINQL
jgi:ribose 5-phosphate isomerase B